MLVEILHTPDCPNVELVRERLRQALDTAGGAATMRERVVLTAEDAVALGMRGSPTILIDGVDPFADDRTAPSLSCRLSIGTGSLAGARSFDELVAAVAGKNAT